MTIIVELKDLTKAYGNKVVVNAVNLQIHEGEILALLGPNGSGKSTILKILAFIENPTSGAVEFQGKKLIINEPKKCACKALLFFRKQSYLALQSTIMLPMD